MKPTLIAAPWRAAAAKSKESLLIHCHKRSKPMKMGTKISASNTYFIIFLFIIFNFKIQDSNFKVQGFKVAPLLGYKDLAVKTSQP